MMHSLFCTSIIVPHCIAPENISVAVREHNVLHIHIDVSLSL